MTSHNREVYETGEYEKVTSSAIYIQDQRQPCKYRSGHCLAVLVQDCLRGDSLVDFYSRESHTLVTFWRIYVIQIRHG